MEICLTIYHCFIHNESRICGMFWSHNSCIMATKLYFGTWYCLHHYQAAENLLWQFCNSFLLQNDKYSGGVKQMKLKYFVVKVEVQKQRVFIQQIRSDLIIVDPLTKGLQPKLLRNMYKVWILVVKMNDVSWRFWHSELNNMFSDSYWHIFC